MGAKQKRRWLFAGSLILTTLWVGFVFSRSMQTATESLMESGWMLELVRKLIPGIGMHTLRKLAHFMEFAILGVLLGLDCRYEGKSRWWASLALGLAVASADEYLQTFFSGRSGQLTDVLIDASGVLAALLFVKAISKKKERL